jgi:hypothetical protein
MALPIGRPLITINGTKDPGLEIRATVEKLARANAQAYEFHAGNRVIGIDLE